MSQIVEVIGKYVRLTKKGSEWYGLCPFHNDHKQSFQVSERKAIWKCFACGAGGTADQFIKKYGGTVDDYKESLRIIPKELYAPVDHTKHLSIEEFKHFEYGLPTNIYCYRDKHSIIKGYTARYGTPTGKVVLPLILGNNGQMQQSRFQAMEFPFVLYNTPYIDYSENIFVVEGEKCVDFASNLMISFATFVTWCGGSNRTSKTNWNLLKGKTVYLMPDNDLPGFKAMDDIAKRLQYIAKKIYVVIPPSDKPVHWDIADSDFTTADQLSDYINENAVERVLL